MIRAEERLLNDHDDDQITDALNHVYANESSALDPQLARIQFALLRRSEEWSSADSEDAADACDEGPEAAAEAEHAE